MARRKEADFHCPICGTEIDIDLREHDAELVRKVRAEVRKPLVDCLEFIKTGAPDIVRKQIDAALAGVKE